MVDDISVLNNSLRLVVAIVIFDASALVAASLLCDALVPGETSVPVETLVLGV